MANKVNLSDRLGIVAQQGQEPYLSWFLGAGCRLFRSDPSWALIMPERGRYEWSWFKDMRDKIYNRGGQILAGLFTMPWWADISQTPLGGWTFKAVGMWRNDLMKEGWLEYVDAFCREFPEIKNVAFPTETNIYRIWRDPKRPFSPAPRSATDYMEMVIKPAAEICHNYGKRVIGGSPTLRGQDERDFKEALEHFRQIRESNKPNDNEASLRRVADFLDIHVYHDKGAAGQNVVNDIKRFFSYFKAKGKPIKYPIYITETGFNEGECFSFWERFWRNLRGLPEYEPEQRQARNYKRLIEYLEADKKKPAGDQLHKQTYCYEMFDPPDRKGDFNGLTQLNPDGTCRPKPAALLLREYWEA